MDNHIFRSALGGFNRQDVTEYIERTRKEAEEAAARLEEQVKTLQDSEAEARASLETCTQEKEELDKQLKDMTLKYTHAKNNWDAQSEAKESFRADVARQNDVIRELTAEKERLTGRVGELEQQAESLRREKERLTQLELDAQRRSEETEAKASQEARAVVEAARRQAEEITDKAKAQAEDITAKASTQAEAIVAEAKAQAEVLLRETEEQVEGTVSQFGALFSSFETIAGHLNNELRKMDVTVSQLPISFNHLRDSLQTLLERAKKR